MPLKTDRSDLPRQADGVAPDPEPRYVTALAQAWHDQWLADGNDERATANGSLLRGSDAGKCAHQLGYELERRIAQAHNAIVREQDSKAQNLLPVIEPSNPLTIADSYRFNIGSMVHDVFQAKLIDAFPGATVEVVGVFDDPDLSLHADALVIIPEDNDARPETHSPADASDEEGGRAGSPEGLLDVDGGDDHGDLYLRGDRSGADDGQDGPAKRERAGSSGDVRGVARPDPGGANDRAPVQDQPVREPATPGSDEPTGEHPEGYGLLGPERQEGDMSSGPPIRRGGADGPTGLLDLSASAGGRPQSTAPGRRVLIELKSINGFGMKSAIGAGRGPAEGPRLSAVLQGAMAAKAMDADELVIAYLALELISPKEAARHGLDDIGRFAAEWSYTREQYEPMADAELKRLGRVLQLVKDGEVVPRSIPGLTPPGARVTVPETGQWELRSEDGSMILDSGSAWACGYCGWQDRCAADLKAGH